MIKRENIFCDVLLKRCPVMTDDGHKIYWDYAHLTKEGAKYFSKRLEENSLFLNYLNSTLSISFNSLTEMNTLEN